MDELEKLIADLQILFLRQKHQINDLKNRLDRDFRDVYDRLAFKMVKKVLYYIEKGIEEEKALMLVYDEFEEKCPLSYLQKIWQIYRPQKSGLLLYGRCYCAQKMRAAGYSLTDIARVLGVSITTVSKLTKKTILKEN